MTPWPTVTLGEVAALEAGIGFPRKLQGRSSGSFPFAKVGDISRQGRSGSSTISDSDHWVDEVDLATLRARLVPTGAVVFAKIGEAIRQNHRVVTGREMLIDNNAMAAIPNEDLVNSRYLFRFLKSIDFYHLASATTVPALRKSVLERVSIPLPPIEEQRRIADILDRADALRVKRREALALVDELTQSIFFDMFGANPGCGGELIEPVRLSNVASVSSGITKGRRLASGVITREVPLMAVVNVQDRRLDLSSVKTIEASEAEVERYRLEVGDILLTEGGDPDKLGRGTRWGGELPDAIHQNHIFKVRVVDERVRPIFLSWFISSDRGKRHFLNMAKQTTGIASINMTQLRAFPITLPPLQMQIEFERRLCSAQSLLAELVSERASLDGLFASLQERAFAGEL